MLSLVSILSILYVFLDWTFLNNYSLVYNLILYLNNLSFNTSLIVLSLLFISKKYYPFALGCAVLFIYDYHLWPYYLKDITFVESGLIIGFTNTHSILFYVILISLLKIIYFPFFRRIVFSSRQLTNLAFLVLLLGAFWSSISSIWGFFWVNDEIEGILLYVTLIITIFTHIIVSKNNTKFYVIGSFLAIYSLMLVRLALITSRHVFFAKTVISKKIILLFTLPTLVFNTYFANIVYYWVANLSYPLLLLSFYYLLLTIYWAGSFQTKNSLVIYIHLFVFSGILVWVFNQAHYLQYLTNDFHASLLDKINWNISSQNTYYNLYFDKKFILKHYYHNVGLDATTIYLANFNLKILLFSKFYFILLLISKKR